ncbi:hypothetical protein ACI7BZ_14150 [Xanthobacter sp. AM11]|uniref:hypothetical protein n=1 Tax=Xanthobacter sp. AM11 TaxID=3380643 RepID=UPI0039BFB33C
MKGSYDDIMSRITDPILWYDEHGVPRYAPFAPDLKSDIYADEAALVEVVCQACRRAFLVCCSRAEAQDRRPIPVAEAIRANDDALYGDPPCHTTEIEARTGMGGCRAGETMTAIGVRVVEYWGRNLAKPGSGWARDPALEVTFTHEDDFVRRQIAEKW